MWRVTIYNSGSGVQWESEYATAEFAWQSVTIGLEYGYTAIMSRIVAG